MEKTLSIGKTIENFKNDVQQIILNEYTIKTISFIQKEKKNEDHSYAKIDLIRNADEGKITYTYFMKDNSIRINKDYTVLDETDAEAENDQVEIDNKIIKIIEMYI